MAVFLGLVYKIITEIINTIVLDIFKKPKYQIPVLKQVKNNTVSISISMIIDGMLFPLLYQHINANKGDKIVMPYHTII